MPSNKMWFGTLERMTWVPVPLATSDFSNVGWAASDTLLNGGGWSRNSWTSHKEFGLNWGMQLRADTQIIKDYADGILGEGPFYFVDPMAASINLFPAWWAAPSMACLDSPPLMNMVPEKVLVPNNTNGLPVYGAKYAPANSTTNSNPIIIPVPPDATLQVGARGVATGNGAVWVTPLKTNGGVGTTVVLALNSATSTALTNTEFFGSDCIAVRVSVVASPGSSITLYGAVARLHATIPISPFPFYYVALSVVYVDGAVDTDTDIALVDGTLDTDADRLILDIADGEPVGLGTVFGGHAGGRGNSGVSFVGAVIESPVGGRPEMSTIAAKFTETGGW